MRVVIWILIAAVVPASLVAQCQIDGITEDVGFFNNRMGFDVDIDETWLVIGSNGGLGLGSSFGTAYVYGAAAGDWVPEIELHALDQVVGDGFAWRMSLSGDRLAVSAQYSGPDSTGSVYIFEYDGVDWEQQAKITPSDVASDPSKLFGASLSLDGDVLVVGAPIDGGTIGMGAAYFFEYDGANWIEVVKHVPADLDANSKFGSAVSVRGSVVVVGAEFAPVGAFPPDAGAAYVYRKVGGVWQEEQKLGGSAPAPDGRFGTSLDLSDDGAYLAVGAWDQGNAGRVHLFEFGGSTWQEVDVLEPEGASFGDDFRFGHAVALDLPIVYVGAPDSDTFGSSSGSIYRYELIGANWEPTGAFGGDDTDSFDSLGWSVASFNGVTAIGAPTVTITESNQGKVYVVATASICGDPFLRGDCNEDSAVDIADAFALLESIFSGATIPTCSRACDANFDDVLNLADPVYALNYLFVGGDSPQEPFPGCGIAPSQTLPCPEFSSCP